MSCQENQDPERASRLTRIGSSSAMTTGSSGRSARPVSCWSACSGSSCSGCRLAIWSRHLLAVEFVDESLRVVELAVGGGADGGGPAVADVGHDLI